MNYLIHLFILHMISHVVIMINYRYASLEKCFEIAFKTFLGDEVPCVKFTMVGGFLLVPV